MPNSDTLVVVVSYENPGYTINSINNLCAQTHPVDVLLWDNNSSSQTKAQLEAANFNGNVIKRLSDVNLLWTPAINRVFAELASDYTYLGFMNNDIYLHANTAEAMIGLLQDDKVGIAGPMGARLGGIGDYVHWSSVAYNNGITEEEFKKYPLQGTYLIGACCFLRSDTWNEVGPLDETMPLGADDHDYSIRIRNAGYKILALPTYPANHVGHASGASQNWGQWGQKSWDSFNTKWSGYYRSEREAIIAHWNGLYMPGWDVGTGWLSDEEREPIYAEREKYHTYNILNLKYNEAYKSSKWNGGF